MEGECRIKSGTLAWFNSFDVFFIPARKCSANFSNIVDILKFARNLKNPDLLNLSLVWTFYH